MEQIKQAVDRARGGRTTIHASPPQPRMPPESAGPIGRSNESERFLSNSIDLNPSHLEANRIVAHNVADPRARAFDMLRTQVLHAMDERGSRCVAVTSPTPGCGKTVTAINLALSIARQEDRRALLVDLDLQRPNVASTLGITCQQGLLGLLHDQTTMHDAMLEANVGRYHCSVLPVERPSIHSSELISSRAMRAVLQEARMLSPTQITVLDLPPTLSGDDVISIVPQIDCVLLVAAVGISTVQEIKECSRLLQSSEIIHLVLNKSTEPTANQYY